MLSAIARWFTTRISTRRCATTPLMLETLESRDVPTVTFHGGPLLKHVEAQALYLGSDWATSSALKQDKALTDGFLKSIVNSPYMDVLTNAGYGVGRGTALNGVVDPVNLNPASFLTDAMIQNILDTQVHDHRLAAPDANRLYVVYVEPGIVVADGSNAASAGTSVTDFLGYHDFFTALSGKNAAYAVIPFQGSPNASDTGATAFQSTTAVTSHELAEAATDPRPFSGWFDTDLGGEISDLANGQESTLNGYRVSDVVDKNDNVVIPSSSKKSHADAIASRPTNLDSAASFQFTATSTPSLFDERHANSGLTEYHATTQQHDHFLFASAATHRHGTILTHARVAEETDRDLL